MRVVFASPKLLDNDKIRLNLREQSQGKLAPIRICKEVLPNSCMLPGNPFFPGPIPSRDSLRTFLPLPPRGMPSSCAEARPVPHCHELVGLISSCSDFKDMQTTHYDGGKSLTSYRVAAVLNLGLKLNKCSPAIPNIHLLVKLTCDDWGANDG